MDKHSKIAHLLRKEVADKCVASAITFGIFAVIIFFYAFSCKTYLHVIRLMCALAFVSSLFRYVISRKVVLDPDNLTLWNKLRISILINSIAWGFIFGIATFELKAQGPSFAVVLVIMTGFVSASIHTLSYDKILFVTFNTFIILPQIFFFLLWYTREGNEVALMLAGTYALYLGYQFKTQKEYRNQVTERLTNQVDLEKSNQELKESQKTLLAQTAELLNASRLAALGDMSAGLAHEINNPLMIIQGSTEQIERLLKEKNPQLLARTTQAKTAIMKIKSIIEGLQFFSQENEKSEMGLVNLQSVLNNTLNISKEMIRAHKVELHVDVFPEHSVKGDSFQLGRIFFNLLQNADDATKDLEHPEEKWIKITAETSAKMIVVKFINGGPKISENAAGKLFHPFFTTKEVGRSVGLSLSLSKGIAQTHGGTLTFYQDEAYTTFVLELPNLKGPS